MGMVGLGKYAKKSCPSPFRDDQNASWGIYEKNGRWMYKDFATGECGDEISLLAQVYKADQKKDFIKLLDLYTDLSNKKAASPIPTPVQNQTSVSPLPSAHFLLPGTDEQMMKLSALRQISIAGLKYAGIRGVLQFGDWRGHEVFAVTDSSGLVVELRRLDGQLFEAYGSMPAHKSHTLKHSRKNWPVGILETSECPGIALVEGMPDFLAMHQFVVEEGVVGRVEPVAMLTSSCDLAAEALDHFKGKMVRIFPHLDEPGVSAAERWQTQLFSAGAKNVDFFNFRAFEFAARSEVKDLCDFNQRRGAAGLQLQQLLET
jgi:hypothetical protein